MDRKYLNVELTASLGFKLSSELSGTAPGDTDFLQKRYVDGIVMVNIGRSLRVLWVNACKYRVGKQKFLLKCACMSLHSLCPNFPILFELINRVGRETSGVSTFKGADKILKTWGNDYKVPDIRTYPKNVDPSMVCSKTRQLVALGAAGFPPISISEQLELERRIREDEVMYLGNLLDDYADVISNSGYVQESGKIAYDSGSFNSVLAEPAIAELVRFSKSARTMSRRTPQINSASERETWA